MLTRLAFRGAASCWTLIAGMLCLGLAPARAADPDFERDIAPLILTRCIECHNATDASGGLDLTRADGVRKGGESGAVVTAGHPETSPLIERIAAGEMPPEKNGKPQPLPAAEVELFRKWVEAGAEWPTGRTLDPYEKTIGKRAGRDWWSLQPVRRPAVPAVGPMSNGAPVQPVDAFIRAELSRREMTPAPPADRRTLLRRVAFDLVGLPPTAEEIDAFEKDTSPEAYEKIVDRLLASPQFGERWGRHWLDLVRFAETNGYERDAVKPNAWRYRDWVIRALNNDMPYDRFVLEQLAGDEVPDRTEETVVATGFLRLGTWDDEPNDPQEYQYERLEDLVHATSTAFLGLTVKCARCHDHKFDPIPQTDYFRVAAAFWGGPVAHRNREWNGGPTAAELGYDVLGWTDLSREPAPLHLLKKGDIHRPGAAVGPGPLTSVVSLTKEFEAPPPESKTAHRRLQLARWIADPGNPLATRAIVNRVWQHHFGEGLVRTPDNLGFLGDKPTHPALLDWLASELVDGGWKLKRLHKLIVMSETYRQASVHPQQAEYERKDAGNFALWHAERRRLDAESIRDAILAVSGRLDLRQGGPSFRALIGGEALEGLSMKAGAYQASPPEETRRRSVYMFTKRSLAVPFMAVFDTCDTTAPTGRRDVTIVAPQALTLLNNEWVHQESEALARRVFAAAADEPERITATWKLVLGRAPNERERTAAANHLRSSEAAATDEGRLAAWASLCHVLLNTNEFMYVD